MSMQLVTSVFFLLVLCVRSTKDVVTVNDETILLQVAADVRLGKASETQDGQHDNDDLDDLRFLDLEQEAELEREDVEQIEFVMDETGAKAPHKNKLILILLEFFFFIGFCGVDRCYMGQTCLGVLKGLTCGGFGFWFMMDWFIVVINSLNKMHSIDALGFHADFGNDHIESPFYLSCVMMGLAACVCCCSCVTVCCSTARHAPGGGVDDKPKQQY